MTNVFYPLNYCQKWAKKFEKFFGEWFKFKIHKNLKKVLKKLRKGRPIISTLMAGKMRTFICYIRVKSAT